MKKVLFGISGLAVLVFVLILTVSAQEQKGDRVNAEIEAVTPSDCGSCASSCAEEMEAPPAAPPAECDMALDCDHENCTECTCVECIGNCEEKCDGHATAECVDCTVHN